MLYCKTLLISVKGFIYDYIPTPSKKGVPQPFSGLLLMNAHILLILIGCRVTYGTHISLTAAKDMVRINVWCITKICWLYLNTTKWVIYVTKVVPNICQNHDLKIQVFMVYKAPDLQSTNVNIRVPWRIFVMKMHDNPMNPDSYFMMTSSNGNIFRVTGEFPSQRPVTRSFDIFFDLRPNNRLSK